MDQATHSKIVSFLWGIADDVLRDLFKRGKYPDVILPMCVLRRLDAKFTLKDLRARSSRQQLLLDFEDYLAGFSPNVQDILVG